MSLPKLCEMNVSSLVKIEGHRAVVINPSRGVVAFLHDPSIGFFSPQSPITHFGKEVSGEFIQWKAYGESEAA